MTPELRGALDAYAMHGFDAWAAREALATLYSCAALLILRGAPIPDEVRDWCLLRRAHGLAEITFGGTRLLTEQCDQLRSAAFGAWNELLFQADRALVAWIRTLPPITPEQSK